MVGKLKLVMSYVSLVMCHMSPVTRHLSPTPAAVATDPPPAYSPLLTPPTMHSRLVHQNRTQTPNKLASKKILN